MDPYLGEIRLFGFTFAPVDWLPCDGRLLPISQYTALFSLLATTYGGDGRTTFAIPDLRGRVPVGVGQGPGLSPQTQGQAAGSETITLTPPQLPPHSHTVAASATATTKNPSGALPGVTGAGSSYDTAAGLTMSAAMIGGGGSSAPVPILQPYLVLNWCIATNGIFPPRS